MNQFFLHNPGGSVPPWGFGGQVGIGVTLLPELLELLLELLELPLLEELLLELLPELLLEELLVEVDCELLLELLTELLLLLELLRELPLEWFPLERLEELLIALLLELLLELPVVLRLVELLLLLATQDGATSHDIGICISSVHVKGSLSDDQIVTCRTSPKFAGIS